MRRYRVEPASGPVAEASAKWSFLRVGDIANVGEPGAGSGKPALHGLLPASFARQCTSIGPEIGNQLLLLLLGQRAPYSGITSSAFRELPIGRKLIAFHAGLLPSTRPEHLSTKKSRRKRPSSLPPMRSTRNVSANSFAPTRDQRMDRRRLSARGHCRRGAALLERQNRAGRKPDLRDAISNRHRVLPRTARSEKLANESRE